MKEFYVYILTTKNNAAFYVGITSDLKKRIYEHKSRSADSHTKKYNIDKLVYFEIFSDPQNAIKREKRLKRWNRSWKVKVIEEKNPDWNDLYGDICK